MSENTWDFKIKEGGHNGHASASKGMPPGYSVTIEGSSDLEKYIYSKHDGKVHSIKFDSSSSPIYDYVITVKAQGPSGITSGSYTLRFVDETGDSYSLEIYSSSLKEHVLRFNSKKPNITSIYWK